MNIKTILGGFLFLAMCFFFHEAYAQEVPVEPEPEIAVAELTFYSGLTIPRASYQDSGVIHRSREDVEEPLYRPEEYRTGEIGREHQDEPRRLPRVIREFSGCIVVPVPIDDRYVGCKINFAPRPARVRFN